MQRRSFVKMGLAAVPAIGLPVTTQSKGGEFVETGSDRFHEQHSLGFSVLAFKVASEDTAGGLFVLEHSNLGKGGPFRHVHPEQDEWLYALEGDFRVEVGEQKTTLKAGDSIVMPRRIPHVWAQVGDKPGRLLVAFTPAGKMEAFFRDFGKTGKLPSDSSVLVNYGLERMGPPLAIP
jgi:mannose-6-phosphate isomerase-like protein (cupin superfamily)